MNVAELIEKLKSMPQDARVVKVTNSDAAGNYQDVREPYDASNEPWHRTVYI